MSAKRFPKFPFEVYGLTYEDNNLRYFDLEQNIRPALERGDITYYLQPKVDLKTGEVTRAEASYAG